MKMKHFLVLVILLISGLSLHAINDDVETVVLKQDYLFKDKNVQSEKKWQANIGETFTVLQEETNWIKVEYRGEPFWLQRKNVALTNDDHYKGKVVITVDIQLQSEGKNKKVVKDLNKGDILTIINSDITGYELKAADGKIGWLKSSYFTRIGPLAEVEIANEKFYQKVLRKEGNVYALLLKIKTWGNKSKARSHTVFILSIILFFLPMFILSKYINAVCSVAKIPTWLIKLSLVFIPIYSLAYLFPIYFKTPLYDSIFPGFFFMFFLVFWAAREWKKIDFHRCPACHSMFATNDEGKFSLGTWVTTTTRKYSDGSTAVSSRTVQKSRNDRQCVKCGHRWSVYSTKIF